MVSGDGLLYWWVCGGVCYYNSYVIVLLIAMFSYCYLGLFSIYRLVYIGGV